MAAPEMVEEEGSGSLASGCIESIICEGLKELPADDDIYLQVLDVKEVQPGRYSAIIHDEKHSVPCFFNSKFENLLKQNQIQSGTIITLKKFNLMDRNDKKILMLLELEITQTECEPLGSPKDIYLTFNHNQVAPQTNLPPKFGHNNKRQVRAPVTSQPRYSGQRFTPLRALNPFNGNPAACIKVRVTNKYPMKTWNKNGKEGRLFSFDIIDDAGQEMKVTAFGEECDKYMGEVHADNVYTIKNFYVKQDNYTKRRYGIEYALTLKRNTEIHSVAAGETFAQKRYDLKTIQDINDLQIDETSNKKVYVDVLAIVTHVGELTSFTSKAGKPFEKREITLVDASNIQLQGTLWGATAQKMDEAALPPGTIVLFNNCSVSTFGGKGISGGSFKTGSSIESLPEYGNLMKFWTTYDESTVQKMAPAERKAYANEKITWKECEETQKGRPKGRPNFKGDWFDITGFVTYIPYNAERPNYYMAGGEKRKKVSDEDGVWKDNNGTVYDTATPCYKLRTKLSDATGAQYVSFFGLTGQAVMDMDCAAYKELEEDGIEKAHRNAYFRGVTVSVRASEDHWNGENRMRYTGNSIKPIDYLAESQRLFAELQAISQTETA